MGTAAAVYRAGKRLFEWLVEPLRADEITQFTLSIPEAQTTTVDSVQGWQNRPPAVLRCECGSEMYQARSTGEIDCEACWRSFEDGSFSEHELVSMICPRCETGMQHGRRHPHVFDIPEWATCPNCQYHWDLNHWF